MKEYRDFFYVTAILVLLLLVVISLSERKAWEKNARASWDKEQTLRVALDKAMDYAERGISAAEMWKAQAEGCR